MEIDMSYTVRCKTIIFSLPHKVLNSNKIAINYVNSEKTTFMLR